MFSHIVRSVPAWRSSVFISSFSMKTSQYNAVLNSRSLFFINQRQLHSKFRDFTSANNCGLSNYNVNLHSNSIAHQANIRHSSKVILIPSRFAASESAKPEESKPSDNSSTSLIQRFKNAYKQYGILLVIVHATTSLMWFSGFYLLAKYVIDLPSMLKTIRLPAFMLKPLENENVGQFAAAVIAYKIFFPVRDLLSLFLTVRMGSILKAKGIIRPIAKEDKMRNLAKEASSQTLRRTRARIKAMNDPWRARMRTETEQMKSNTLTRWKDFKTSSRSKMDANTSSLRMKLLDKYKKKPPNGSKNGDQK